jgi:hypothetical protein
MVKIKHNSLTVWLRRAVEANEAYCRANGIESDQQWHKGAPRQACKKAWDILMTGPDPNVVESDGE